MRQLSGKIFLPRVARSSTAATRKPLRKLIYMEQTDFSPIDKIDNRVSPVLADSAEVLTAAMFALPDAFYLFDAGKRLSRTNHAGAQLERTAADALVGRRCCEMFWGVEGASECLVVSALATVEKIEVEILADS